MESKSSQLLESVSDRIALMAIYRDEWKHRDQTFSMYLWRFVSLSLIITFLPNFLEAAGTRPVIVDKLFPGIFPVLGIFCSCLGCYIGISDVKRIQSIDTAYKNLASVFSELERPKAYRNRLMKLSLNMALCCVLYGVTIALSLVNLAFIL